MCERFTTSKLKDFEDLLSIGTYGFRGEALASISHIAHLRVTTKTADSSCAWQAHYQDGKLISPKPGQSADPRPTAGRPGTQITVEDLFYNIPNRRRAFKSPSEEYQRILDVVTRHAVHCDHVAFSVKKHGESGAGFSVSAAASKTDRIRQAYGTSVARELIEFSAVSDRWGFKASGYCSNANYSAKRTTILLFINHRSVESSAVRKAIEQAYQMFLPKGGHPFVYLNLEIDPARVDVNVHPTKREVHFLNEDEVIELVCADIRERLTEVDTSRTFKTQTLLPTITTDSINPPRSTSVDDASAQPTTPATKRPYENNLVRTDSKLRKITSMLPPALTPNATADDSIQSMSASPFNVKYITTEREQAPVRLTSVKRLRAAVRENMHTALTETFAALTYVGLVDPHRRLAAMQSGVSLYLVDYGLISNELFYQIGITDFGNFGCIQLTPDDKPKLKLKEILNIAAELEIETDTSLAGLKPETVVEKIYSILFARRDMLKEYFNLVIDDDGHLLTIPLLIKGYIPCLAKLPTFLLRLGPFVDWTDEERCFHTFLVELAGFYVPEVLPPIKPGRQQDVRASSTTNDVPQNTSTPTCSEDTADSTAAPVQTQPETQREEEIEQRAEEEEDPFIVRRRREIEFSLEHILFPAFRSRLLATKGMLKGIIEIADLKGLYRVFERC